MDIRIFIMAQGKGSRWYDPDRQDYLPPAPYKQLLRIGNETIISRTLRQLNNSDVIVVANRDFLPFLPKERGIGLITLREPTDGLLHGIWKTKNWWGDMDKIIILLGDVIYSNDAIRGILNDRAINICVFGRHTSNFDTGKEASELFALSFLAHHFLEVENRLFKFIQMNHDAKLWDFSNSGVILSLINDYTDDIDSIQEYEQFFGKLYELALKDDELLVKG